MLIEIIDIQNKIINLTYIEQLGMLAVGSNQGEIILMQIETKETH